MTCPGLLRRSHTHHPQAVPCVPALSEVWWLLSPGAVHTAGCGSSLCLGFASPNYLFVTARPVHRAGTVELFLAPDTVAKHNEALR